MKRDQEQDERTEQNCCLVTSLGLVTEGSCLFVRVHACLLCIVLLCNPWSAVSRCKSTNARTQKQKQTHRHTEEDKAIVRQTMRERQSERERETERQRDRET